MKLSGPRSYPSTAPALAVAGRSLPLYLRKGENRVAATLLDDAGRVSSTVAASYPFGGPGGQEAR